MSADESPARRVDQTIAEFRAAEDQKRYDSFEQLMCLVDSGDLTLETVLAIQRELGAVAVTAVYPASVYQARAIKRLEAGIDEARDV